MVHVLYVAYRRFRASTVENSSTTIILVDNLTKSGKERIISVLEQYRHFYRLTNVICQLFQYLDLITPPLWCELSS